MGDVQSQGMQGMRKMISFEFVAGDASPFPDHLRVRDLRIRCYVGVRESQCRPRKPQETDVAVIQQVRRG